ncbi:golgin subfamily A member 6-like protein 25 isoform X2 [Prorops nasuta]
MVFSACSYLALAGAVWIFLRLLQACFWLPRHLKKQNNVQRMLEDKVDDYERYVLECERKEKELNETEEENGEKLDITQTEKWKERRECLTMLKRELGRVRDGDDSSDWDKLLEEEEKKILEEAALLEEKEKEDSESSNNCERKKSALNADGCKNEDKEEKCNISEKKNSDLQCKKDK